MRILHTSDWHLGRSFHGAGLLEAQAAWVDHLLEVVERERVDVVLVAGDVYDRALPGLDAVALAEDAFGRLAASRARVVVTSGNHDSARRLGFASGLIDAAGVHVRTVAERSHLPVVIDDEHGPVSFYGIPYLQPEFLAEPWDLPARTHQAAMTAAMDRVRADLAGRASGRSVVLAHVFAAGAASSDSERDISVGGIQRVGVPTFDGVSYAALGHLHGPQTLTERIRYSGSPLAYSFSEADQAKVSWLVDLDAAGEIRVESVPAPVPRPLSRLRGTLEELLGSGDHDAAESHWVQVSLTDQVPVHAARDRLLRRFPHLLHLELERIRPTAGVTHRPRGASRSPYDVGLEFLDRVRGAPASVQEREILADAVGSCCGTGPEASDQVVDL
ncbi:exonuclease SbcCD subunit D [Alteromonas gracilis]